MKLAYCDFIAYVLRAALNETLNDATSAIELTSVSDIQWDLNPDGSFRSPTKTILVKDFNDTSYKITIEQV